VSRPHRFFIHSSSNLHARNGASRASCRIDGLGSTRTVSCLGRTCNRAAFTTDKKGREWCLRHARLALSRSHHHTDEESCAGTLGSRHAIAHRAGAVDRVIDDCRPKAHAWCLPCARHTLAYASVPK
jgi:hypothetical protein